MQASSNPARKILNKESTVLNGRMVSACQAGNLNYCLVEASLL